MSENISEAILYEFHIINLRAYEKSRSQYYRELLSNNDNSISYIQTPIGNQELIKMVNMTIATKYAM
jgi:hypothetical protein